MDAPANAPIVGDVQELGHRLAELNELALDARSSWNHAADALWSRLDPSLWEATRNPWLVVNSVPLARMRTLLEEPDIRQLLRGLVSGARPARAADTWFARQGHDSRLAGVAYFCAEFMLNEALPIYSGGLGNVAADQLKAASDLGLPVTGVGLLYQQGYFHQLISSRGEQVAVQTHNEPDQLPLSPVLNDEGETPDLQLPLPGQALRLRAWHAQVGSRSLYLLDSNHPANEPYLRSVTASLYPDDPQLRLLQQYILGVGGWRLLSALGVAREVCHLNEGYCAFAVLERARDYMESEACDFDEALMATRAGNLYTTHTILRAGHGEHDPAMVSRWLAPYVTSELRMPADRLLGLGRVPAADGRAGFSLDALAFNGSSAANAVSRRHAQACRQLYSPLFGRWPLGEIPVTHVTNGVHVPSWDSAAADSLWTSACGKRRWLGTLDELAPRIFRAAGESLWAMRLRSRKSLVRFARKRLSAQLVAAGGTPSEVQFARHVLDPNVMTIGFARRFAEYKRPHLLLQDQERLLRLLNDSDRPVQVVVAGKAHPSDAEGQALVRGWVDFARRPEARERVVFIADADMRVTEMLAQGVDLWISTPRTPWEACGTSGMKVLVNGGLNLSVLDGWWAEAYTPEVGWAIDEAALRPQDRDADARVASRLYDLLEREAVPQFYKRDNARQLPLEWIERMRCSMAMLTPRYSTNRVVRDYVERYYLPAAGNYRSRVARGGSAARALSAWLERIGREWPSVGADAPRFVASPGAQRVDAVVRLGRLAPEDVRVELYSEKVAPVVLAPVPLATRDPKSESGAWNFTAQLPAGLSPDDCTVRVIATRDSLAVPHECRWIHWQR